MGWVGDINELFDRVPWIKRLKPLPDQVVALEKRVQELEGRLDEVGDGRRVCLVCGGGPIELTVTKEPMKREGVQQVVRRRCHECGAEAKPEVTVLVEPKPATPMPVSVPRGENSWMAQ